MNGLGVQYYKARMYSADLGRFIQTDPIGMTDDMNLYAYVGNNAVNRRDPSGRAGVNLGYEQSSGWATSSIFTGESYQVAGIINGGLGAERHSGTISVGGAFIPIVGGAGSSGLYLSTYPLDLGLFSTGEVGLGADIGLGVKLGFQTGEITSTGTNINGSYLPGSLTISLGDDGNISGFSAGLAIRYGVSLTYTPTETIFSLRDFFLDLFDGR